MGYTTISGTDYSNSKPNIFYNTDYLNEFYVEYREGIISEKIEIVVGDIVICNNSNIKYLIIEKHKGSNIIQGIQNNGDKKKFYQEDVTKVEQ